MPITWASQANRVLIDGYVLYSPVRRLIWENGMQKLAQPKKPGENFFITLDFTDQLTDLGAGVVLSSGTGVVVDLQTGATVTGTLLASGTATVSGNGLKLRVQAGTDGHNYRVRYSATASDTSVLIEDVLVEVRD